MTDMSEWVEERNFEAELRRIAAERELTAAEAEELRRAATDLAISLGSTPTRALEGIRELLPPVPVVGVQVMNRAARRAAARGKK